jgi:hypothetical protein
MIRPLINIPWKNEAEKRIVFGGLSGVKKVDLPPANPADKQGHNGLKFTEDQSRWKKTSHQRKPAIKTALSLSISKSK